MDVILVNWIRSDIADVQILFAKLHSVCKNFRTLITDQNDHLMDWIVRASSHDARRIVNCLFPMTLNDSSDVVPLALSLYKEHIYHCNDIESSLLNLRLYIKNDYNRYRVISNALSMHIIMHTWCSDDTKSYKNFVGRVFLFISYASQDNILQRRSWILKQFRDQLAITCIPSNNSEQLRILKSKLIVSDLITYDE